MAHKRLMRSYFTCVMYNLAITKLEFSCARLD